MTDGMAHDGWISLQEASAILGVATSTLRRWGDSGQVPMTRTLGGHRRFARDAVEKLSHSRGAAPAVGHRPAQIVPNAGGNRASWGVDEREMARQEWHTRLATKTHTDHMRGLGQRLLGMLIQYVNRREDDRRFLEEAHAVGATYGREAHEASVDLHDTVEAFLFFRNAFSEMAMPIPGIAQPTDLDEAVALQKRLNRFMDATLLGLIGGYQGTEAVD
jgi:excisionase family DNA binding protein